MMCRNRAHWKPGQP